MQSTIHSSVCTSPVTALQPLTHALACPRGSQNSTSRKEKILHYIYVTRARFLRLLAVIKSTNVSAQALQCKVGAGAHRATLAAQLCTLPPILPPGHLICYQPPQHPSLVCIQPRCSRCAPPAHVHLQRNGNHSRCNLQHLSNCGAQREALRVEFFSFDLLVSLHHQAARLLFTTRSLVSPSCFCVPLQEIIHHFESKGDLFMKAAGQLREHHHRVTADGVKISAYPIPNAVDVLTSGSYDRIPKMIKVNRCCLSVGRLSTSPCERAAAVC